MAKFKILYTPYGEHDDLDPNLSSEHEVEIPGWNDANWKDDDFCDALDEAVSKQLPTLSMDDGEIEDWWPVKGNEDFTHLEHKVRADEPPEQNSDDGQVPEHRQAPPDA